MPLKTWFFTIFTFLAFLTHPNDQKKFRRARSQFFHVLTGLSATPHQLEIIILPPSSFWIHPSLISPLLSVSACYWEFAFYIVIVTVSRFDNTEESFIEKHYKLSATFFEVEKRSNIHSLLRAFLYITECLCVTGIFINISEAVAWKP